MVFDPAQGGSAGGGVSDIVDDTTPQLGGDLDTNGNDIVVATGDNILFDANTGFSGSGSDVVRLDTGGTTRVSWTNTRVQYNVSLDNDGTNSLTIDGFGRPRQDHISSTSLNLSNNVGDVHANTGAISTVTLTLPAADDSSEWHFLCLAAQTFQIKAPASHTITMGDQTTAANGTIETTEVGAWCTVYCSSASSDTYHVLGSEGTWTLDGAAVKVHNREDRVWGRS